MRQDWIFDVLADLHSFAELNDLPALAAQIATTVAVARAELAARDGVAFTAPQGKTRKPH